MENALCSVILVLHSISLNDYNYIENGEVF